MLLLAVRHRCGVGAAHRSHRDAGADGAVAVSALLTVAKPVVTCVFPALPFTPNCVSMHFPGFFLFLSNSSRLFLL